MTIVIVLNVGSLIVSTSQITRNLMLLFVETRHGIQKLAKVYQDIDRV